MAAKYVVSAKEQFQGIVSGATAAPQFPPEWQSGLFDCCQDGNICAQTTFCSWCTTSNVVNKLDNNVSHYECGLCAFMFGADICTRGAASGFWALSTRRQTLQRFGIRSEPHHESCLSALCCAPCNSCQIQRELNIRGQSAGGVCVGDHGEPFGTAMQTQKYSTTLFDCTGTECLDAFCCGPCGVAHMTTRLNALDNGSGLALTGSGPKNEMDGKECLAAMFGNGYIIYGMRREFLTRYGIGDEDALTSCITVTFCTPCSMLQQRREMGIRGQWPGGVIASEAPPSVGTHSASAVQQGVVIGNGQQKTVSMV